ncbi:hypothetical protein [Paenibacillus sp. FSL K6-2859]|uniref:hypothetical protein n=1 Tax=Paenibacillus sp. FSL K6-2859 TaxID=2921482 RepID=UPI0030FBF94A
MVQLPSVFVYQSEILVAYFYGYVEVVQFAKVNLGTRVHHDSSEKTIWTMQPLPAQVHPLDAMLINQVPEMLGGGEKSCDAAKHAGIEEDKNDTCKTNLQGPDAVLQD